MRRLAVFVDAGYFWVQTTTAVLGRKAHRSDLSLNFSELRKQLLASADKEFPNTDLLRVYWYDGPGNGGKAEEHKQIEMLDDFKLRLGTRNSVGQQKAVDGLIIADLIGLAQNRAITDALIVSGDADLTPGIVAAQGLGLRVHLLTLSSFRATSDYLRAEADKNCFWEDALIKKFAKQTGCVKVVSNISNTGQSLEERIESVVRLCLKQLTPQEKSALPEGVGLPKAIDSQLLKFARNEFGPNVDQDTRHRLRISLKAQHSLT
jgi:uncharacterized LabA/DUF88 family protein